MRDDPPAHKPQVSGSLNIMKISFKRLLALLLVCCLVFPAPAAAQTVYVKGSLTGTQRLDIAYQFLDELNSYRVQHGVGKLKMDTALLDYATQRGAELMVVCEHQHPDGTGVFETPLLHNKWAGETCLMTSLSDSVPSAAKSILNSFRSSAPHDKILKMKEFSYVGIGVVEIGYHMYCVSVDFCSEGREMAKTTKNTKKTWTFNVKPSLFEGLFVTQTPLYAGGTPQKAVVSGTNVHRKQVSLTYDIDQSPVSNIKSLNTDILDVKNGYLVPKKEGNATLTATVNGKKVSTMVLVRKGTGTSPETKQESLTDGIEKTGTEGTAGNTKQTAEAKQITPNGAYMITASADHAKGIAVKNNSIKSGAALCLQNKMTSETQVFTCKPHRDGTVTMISTMSDMALTVQPGSSRTNAVTMEEVVNSDAKQRWKVMQNEDATVTFVNKANGKALDLRGGASSTGTPLQAYPQNGTKAQKFIMKKVGAPAHKWAGTYSVRYAADRNYAVDITGASRRTGANVQLYRYNGTEAQKFQVLYAGNGWYRIRNIRSGKVLDVAGGSRRAGANVQQYTWDGTDAQMWKFIQNPDGTVTIRNKLGTVLDLSGAIKKSGQNICAYTPNGTKAQKWILSA